MHAPRWARPPSRRRRRNAACRRRRCWNSIPPAISSATGAGRARATSGRSRTTASPSITRATCGSAATSAATIPRRSRTAMLKFTRAGKFLMQIGHASKSGGSNDTENFGGPAKIFVDPTPERGVHRRRLRQPPRHRDRCRYRQVQAPLGRVRHQAGRHEHRPLRSVAPPAKQFRTPVHCAELSNDGLLVRL